MDFAILGTSPKNAGYSTKRILEEAKKEFKKAELIPVIQVKLRVNGELDALYGKRSLREYDYILPRIDSKRAEVGYPVVRFLDDLGVKKPYPAEAILVAHNKFLTLEQLKKNNVPVPRTFFTGSKESANEILKKEKLPLIIKLLSGFGGKGVMIIESMEAARSVIETMKTLKQEILIEEFVENPGEDIRGIVAGDEIIASFKRIAAEGEKKANIYSGGRAERFKLTSEMEDICHRSAKAIKARVCAVDMLNGKNGLKVTEVNINPGLEGIEKATNINVAQRIVSFVKGELKQ